MPQPFQVLETQNHPNSLNFKKLTEQNIQIKQFAINYRKSKDEKQIAILALTSWVMTKEHKSNKQYKITNFSDQTKPGSSTDN